MRVVIALGGNAISPRGDCIDTETMRKTIASAACRLAWLCWDHEVVLTHGNGPQIGALALEAGSGPGRPTPIDVLGAETEGSIGYMLEQAIEEAVPSQSAATLLTQTVVDRDDPAFGRPSKPIGPLYPDEKEARELAARFGWDVGPDTGGMRRVVPSPEPVRIVELEAIRLLVDAGFLVICAGGGGVPIIEGPYGAVHGVEAVVDKDATAALLAEGLDADMLLIATDVEGVMCDFNKPEQHLLDRVTPSGLRALDLPTGSMGPKAEACARFVERTGKRAAIARWDELEDAIEGRAGTQVVANAPFRVRDEAPARARDRTSRSRRSARSLRR